MLKKRLIPTLLLKDGRMIKTIQFDRQRDVGNPVTAAKIYNAQSADELVFLDITATQQNRNAFFDVISKVADECFMPFCAGGGVRTLEDIRKLLLAGADKVAINTAAVRRPEFIREAAEKFGSQCIVVAIDVRPGNGGYAVYTNRGRDRAGVGLMDWVRTAEEYGAGEIMITNIERDGMMHGYDLKLVRMVSDAAGIPVIASGGVGTLTHLVEGLVEGHASAVAAASIFHFTDQSPIKAKMFLKEAGIDVRAP
jgi:cyclase